MKWRKIIYVVGVLTFFLGAAMAVPLAVALLYRDQSVLPITKSIVITVFFGSLFYLCTRKSFEETVLSPKEGMAIVALGWTAAGLFGSLPFYLGGVFPGFTDAFFESISGFTTTGASVLTNIEILPKGLLLWRSLIQWIGGMGIILLSLAVLPFLGVGGMQLYKAEVPGDPDPDKLKPRLRETALILWKVYVLISAAQVIFLMIGGMSFFDSLCHALTTMPTGGFSVKNASIAHYNSLYIQCVIIFFMFLAGINFALHFQMVRGKPLAFWRDSECRFYIAGAVIMTIIVSINLYGNVYKDLGKSIQYGAFQVVSIMTTTGFATADYVKWPPMSQAILLFLMFLGASAGSTGGGMKCLRVMLCLKYCYKELFSLIHPRAVSHVKIGGKAVSNDVMKSILAFLALYMALFWICTLIMTSLGVDFTTSFASVAASLGNIGPGFGSVGPASNYSHLPLPGKWLLIWCMLLGRLEIYTIIVFLVPEFWRK